MRDVRQGSARAMLSQGKITAFRNLAKTPRAIANRVLSPNPPDNFFQSHEILKILNLQENMYLSQKPQS